MVVLRLSPSMANNTFSADDSYCELFGATMLSQMKQFTDDHTPPTLPSAQSENRAAAAQLANDFGNKRPWFASDELVVRYPLRESRRYKSFFAGDLTGKLCKIFHFAYN